MILIELNHSIMKGYKKPWNPHTTGPDCWCKPTVGGDGDKISWRFHKNYVWVDDGTQMGRWDMNHEHGLTREDFERK